MATVLNLQLLMLDVDGPLIPRGAQIDDAAIVAALSRSIGAMRDDAHKVVLLQTLFGRRWAEVLERLHLGMGN